VIVAAALCPAPPVLVPAVSRGAAAELDALRAACDAALAEVLGVDADRLVVVAAGPTGVHAATAAAGLGTVGVGFDVAPLPGSALGAVADRGAPLPLALTVGRWLLTRAGHPCGPDDAWHTVEPASAAALGEQLAVGGRTTLLVLGEGSSAVGADAPLPQDERASAFDAAVAAAAGAGDLAALGALDLELASALGATGWAPWQVLAAAAGGRPGRGRLHAYDAPYGVGYVVATWRATGPAA